MTTEYRMLGPWEPVEKGDEYLWAGEWSTATNWKHCPPKQMTSTKYRRPLPRLPACVPQWRHPEAPGCPVHVLWAESPSTVRTVAQVVAEAKPVASKVYDGDVDPGTGYYIVPIGEFIQEGDEWYSGAGKWKATQLPGGQYKYSCPLSTLRRKKAPEYRPYANAAEAAAGLQGKLIRRASFSGDWVPVTRVSDTSVYAGNLNFVFEDLLKYTFTDGTPCGVLITNQGKQ